MINYAALNLAKGPQYCVSQGKLARATSCTLVCAQGYQVCGGRGAWERVRSVWDEGCPKFLGRGCWWEQGGGGGGGGSRGGGGARGGGGGGGPPPPPPACASVRVSASQCSFPENAQALIDREELEWKLATH